LQINSDEVLQEITKELPQHLQNYLGNSDGIPIHLEGFYAPEIYLGKEQVRRDGVRKPSNRNYQRKKR